MKQIAIASLRRFAAAVFAVVLFVAPAAAAAPTGGPGASDGSRSVVPAAPDVHPAVERHFRIAQATGGYEQGADMRNEGYNSQYIFGMTKGVAGSTLNPGLKPLVFLFTVPLDIVTLPFTAIAGFF